MNFRYLFFFSLIFCITIFQSCHQKKPIEKVDVLIESPKIEIPTYTKKEGILTVLMDNSMTSYFIYKGRPMGYEYEMLALFAKENDMDLEIKIIDALDNILDSLTTGVGDLVAANLTISKKRMEIVAFSQPLFRTRQILVQRLPENRRKMKRDDIEKSLIRDRLDLGDKKIVVRKNSSYELMLENLINETGVNLKISYSPGDFVTEHLIEMVSNKEINYTICDENKAIIFNAYYNEIDIKTPMSLSQPIAWAVNKESTKLLSTLNSWIDKRLGSLEFNMIHNKYFEMSKRKRHIINKEFSFIKEGNISIYDELIKKYAMELGWDWRLLAALIFQESNFDHKTKSWRGATGLMQLMPPTAKSYGIKGAELVNPEKNIAAGTQHLTMLQKYWESELSDETEILKFTLGSYNVGLGHVQDAIRLAKKYGVNPNKWDDNVAQMLLNKSIPKYYKDPVVKYGYCRGKEPVNYVKSILNNYSMYRKSKKIKL